MKGNLTFFAHNQRVVQRELFVYDNLKMRIWHHFTFHITRTEKSILFINIDIILTQSLRIQ